MSSDVRRTTIEDRLVAALREAKRHLDVHSALWNECYDALAEYDRTRPPEAARSPEEMTEQFAILKWIMRRAESAKEQCSSDPETPTAIRNSVLVSISSAAAQALGIVRGPSFIEQKDDVLIMKNAINEKMRAELDAHAASPSPDPRGRSDLPKFDPTLHKGVQGVYRKFDVKRTDGDPTGKHAGCEYFVLDTTHDEHARAALAAYADSCAKQYPVLADDMRVRYGLIAQPPAAPATTSARAEAVAWQALVSDRGWTPISEHSVLSYRNRGLKVRPLYTAPPEVTHGAAIGGDAFKQWLVGLDMTDGEKYWAGQAWEECTSRARATASTRSDGGDVGRDAK